MLNRLAVIGCVLAISFSLAQSPDGEGSRFPSQAVLDSARSNFGSTYSRESPSARLGTGWATGRLAVDPATRGMIARLDKELAASSNDMALLRKYEANMIAKPDDSLAAFAFAYVMLEVGEDTARRGESLFRLGDFAGRHAVAWWIARLHRPGDLDYAKVRLLCEGRLIGSEVVIPAARSLYRADPADTRIAMVLAAKLASTMRNPELDEARRIVDMLYELDPKNFRYVWSNLSVYDLRFTHLGKNREDGQRALRMADELLEMLPKGSTYYELIETGRKALVRKLQSAR